MKSIAFFNNKGGVGKTTLVYHLAWMFAETGKRVLAVDLDPQSNVTSMFLNEDQLTLLFETTTGHESVYQAFGPLLSGKGDIEPVRLKYIHPNLALLPGDLGLSKAEDELSSTWPDCLSSKERAFRVISGFSRIIGKAVTEFNADIVLIDVGPNLGSLNRSALICADYVVVPLAPDLYSLQGLRNLGPTLRQWRTEWFERLAKSNPAWQIQLPKGNMLPIGYVVLQHAMRTDRPVKAYLKWMSKIPSTYAENLLDDPNSDPNLQVSDDPNCLALLKNYRSLMPLSQEARKPMFLLKAVDGALGSHAKAVQDCYNDFEKLTNAIESKTEVD